MSLDEPLRLEGLGGGVVEEDEDEAADDFESTGTARDLTTEADPAIFDQTFQATKSDVPIGVGEEVPIPRPWQGIPRVAMVFNFNYIWDDTNNEWVRDTGNSGGGGVWEVAATGQEDVDNAGGSAIGTGLTDPTDRLRSLVAFGDPSQLTNTSFNVYEGTNAPGTNETRHYLTWDEGASFTGTQEWILQIRQDTSINPITYDWAVVRLTG